MKKLITIVTLLALLLVGVGIASAANYNRGVTRQYNYGPGAAPGIVPPGYGPGFGYGGFDYEEEYFNGFYDPVIFGGLGNYYYGGGMVATGFPFYPNQASIYIPRGNWYRYEAGPYGYGAGYGFSGAGFYGSSCITGCPGFGSPANRMYGIGY